MLRLFPLAIEAQQAVVAVSQKLVGAQSELTAQLVLQAVPAWLQPRLFGQATPPFDMHTPLPLQALLVSWPEAQVEGPQLVVATG